jgi:hypothetical protein
VRWAREMLGICSWRIELKTILLSHNCRAERTGKGRGFCRVFRSVFFTGKWRFPPLSPTGSEQAEQGKQSSEPCRQVALDTMPKGFRTAKKQARNDFERKKRKLDGKKESSTSTDTSFKARCAYALLFLFLSWLFSRSRAFSL